MNPKKKREKKKGEGEETNHPKWSAQNKMAEVRPNISVTIIVQINYIKGEDSQVAFSKCMYLLLSRDALNVTRFRNIGNKGMERHLIDQILNKMLVLCMVTNSMSKVIHKLQHCLY